LKNNASQDQVLEQYWMIIRKRKWTILSFTAALTVFVTLVSLMLTPYYRSTAIIQIRPKATAAIESSGVGEMGTSAKTKTLIEAYYMTQYLIMESDAVLSRAIQTVQLEHQITDFDDKKRPTAFLKKHLSVVPKHQTQLVGVTVEYPDSEKAALFANAISEAYIAYNRERTLGEAEDALRWLTQRQTELQQAKRESDLKVIEFRKDNKMISSGSDDGLSKKTLSQLQKMWGTINADLVRQKAVIQELERLNRANDRIALANYLSATDEGLADQIQSLNSLEQTKAELQAKYKPAHPQMQEIERALALTLKRIDTLTNTEIQSRRAGLKTVQSIATNLQKELEAAEIDVSKLSGQLIDLKFHETEAERNEEFYRSLDRRRTQVGLAKRMEANNIDLLDRAFANPSPIWPSIPLNLLGSLFMGLLGGCALAYLREFFDATVKVSDNLENTLDSHILGIIPKMESMQLKSLKGPKEQGALVHALPHSSVTEAIRSIRTTLQLAKRKKPIQSMVITSAIPKEGKTFVSINLATINAMSGNRTLVIDGDLRRPTFHKRLEIENQQGLTDVLMGHCHILDVVRETHVPNLYAITGGTYDPTVAEALDTEHIKQIIADIGEFDTVIIDTSPIGLIADGLVWASLVDAHLLVVETGRAQLSMVRRAIKQARAANGRLLGVIINKLPVDKAAYGYPYYHYRRYYQGPPSQQKTANE
jgi:capsular exopolysaccharide synthesis family protein